MPPTLAPVTLTGQFVQLEPLSLDHVDELTAAAAADRSSFGWTVVPDGTDAMRTYIAGLLADHGALKVLPFAQRDLGTNAVVGCTRFLDPHWWRKRPAPDEVEIGGTWLGAAAQRTPINTEAKLLLLTHAFDSFGVWRVAICTDERNTRSRTAIERIGASFEGVLRSHRVRSGEFGNPTGDVIARNTAIYSIVSADWPAVRERLVARLES
ncbi:MAG TPA: GNAT family protein [Ilumatobacter sp.]|nr:GNAT family protein [Ilumatobacter sp.]